MLAGIGISPFGPTLYFGVTHVGKIAENLNLLCMEFPPKIALRTTCTCKNKYPEKCPHIFSV